MSTIRSTSIGDYTPPAEPVDADTLSPEEVLRKPPLQQKRISRFIPLLRRPPALMLDMRKGSKDMSFNTLLESHVAKYRQRTTSDLAYSLADFMIRRIPEAEARGIDPEAEQGLEVVTETVRMFEHIHIAQSVDEA